MSSPIAQNQRLQPGVITQRKRDYRDTLLRRLAVAPFEIAIGLVTIWAGMAGLFQWSITRPEHITAIPSELMTFVNLLYALSGVALVGGILHRLKEVEVFGLVTLLGSLMIRAVVLLFATNWELAAFGSLLSSFAIMIAIIIRLWVALSHRAVVLAEKARRTDDADAVASVAL